jgi:hypothetical protein
LLGNEIHATLLVDGRSIVARLDADQLVKPDSLERFTIAPAHLLLFDPDTGRRIG